MKNLTKALLLCFVLFMSGVLANAQEAAYDSLLNELFPEDGPGGTAIIVKDGKTIYLKAFGKATVNCMSSGRLRGSFL